LDCHLSDFAHLALLNPPMVAVAGLQKQSTIDRPTLVCECRTKYMGFIYMCNQNSNSNAKNPIIKTLVKQYHVLLALLVPAPLKAASNRGKVCFSFGY
jgi:hypothetical protein